MYFRLVKATCALALLASASGSFNVAASRKPRQVAIIGAGPAGSATAYFLRKFADEANRPINITVFEATDRIGGRSITINPFNDANMRSELGASIFIDKNYLLCDAVREFGLHTKEPYGDADHVMGIWDGSKFVFTMDTNRPYWWNMLRVVWRYGYSAPTQMQNLVDASVAIFLKLYEKEYFPFRSLTQRVYELGLLGLVGSTGEDFLNGRVKSDLYVREIVQASTRVNYASNLARIHALDTMVSMAPEGAMSVVGGNWQIFDQMIRRSGAYASLNTSVVSITLDSSDPTTKFAIKTMSRSEDTPESTTPARFDTLFDKVVIATPVQFSKISAGTDVISAVMDDIPYIELHVTLLATSLQLSPAYFGLGPTAEVPGMVLTTLGGDDTPDSGAQGAGSAGFFSINILRTVVNPATGKTENLFKIFSPAKITSEFLGHIFGVDIPSTITADPSVLPSENTTESISWYHAHVFNAYPRALPRATFQDPIVGPGVFYTSGMESVISTMETMALAGRNVARLIVDDALMSDEAQLESESQLTEEGGSQQKLGSRDLQKMGYFQGRSF